MNRNIFFLLLAAFLAYSFSVEAKTYRWVDENGVLRFSDTPPPGMAVEEPAAPRSKSTGDEDPFERARASIPIRFELNGEIVDPDGNPLTDVTMTIEEHHFPPSSFEYKTIRKKSKINKTFAVACTGCPIHSLSFRTPGYVSEEYTISASEHEEHSMMARFVAVMSGKEDPGGGEPFVFRRSSIRIVLHPESSFVRVILRDVQLTTGEEGPFMVLAGKPTELKFVPSYLIEKEKAKARDKDGPFAVILFSTENAVFSELADAEEANSFHTLDIPLHLELQGVEGGFLPVETTAFKIRDKYNELEEAPENGYRKQLKIIPSQKKSVFFYCRIGKYYGKGQLYQPVIRKLRDVPYVHAFVVLYLSPVAGSRNLRTHL
ncbi:DUF4124 domain-containing protein [uncultured Desulfosarcina sp.]|uniref:DUF4124 domain-containing protein n=1 Tax=uncultured Desulfosarcina sp. TaxID=218289 RepID=UPI0029C7E4F8|nr:DUF4124 domain-containing protein [uncultured Desulfosarcina sp.]